MPGYFPSTWPAECGGPRRQKGVSTPGLDLKPGERLESTIRDMGGWSVMLVQRGPGELFVQGGAGLGRAQRAPHFRARGDSAGWLERIDPVTLETLARSPDLPSGGHLWCGAVVVHQNGDLYVTNGRYCHRLDESCSVRAERELPVDAPYNGLLILPDGNLLMKNLGHDPAIPCQFSVLEPERLEPVAEPFGIPEPCMGRFSSDRTDTGEFVYCSSATQLYRLRYEAGELSLDPDWRGSYDIPGEDQSDGWDTCIGSDSVWMMDMGRPAWWRGRATAPQRAFRFSIDDASDRDVLVAFDSQNAKVGAWRYEGPGRLDPLWQRDLRSTVQMMLYADTGELVLEDARAFGGDSDTPGSVVMVDVETGAEKGRTLHGAQMLGGMFLCPGFGRDFYAASTAGPICRIYVS